MPLEETGKMMIVSLKNKNSDVVIEYKVGKETKKIKVAFAAVENISLCEGEELSKKTLDEILAKDKEEELRKYLVNLIIKKPYSEKELFKKAVDKFEDEKMVKKVISSLRKDKLIDDEEYVLTYLDYFKANNYGKYYIFNFFKEKGVNEKYFKDIKISDEEEKEKARKYFETIKNKFVSANFVRQKKRIFDAMLARGFEVSLINDLLKTLNVDENKEHELFLKDYRKAKIKYLKDKDPQAKITNYLINRGFSLNMINQKLHEGDNND